MDRIRTMYAREFGLDHTFEADVARGLGEFAKGYDSSKDLFAVAEIDGRIVGSIVIAAESDQLAKWGAIRTEQRYDLTL